MTSRTDVINGALIKLGVQIITSEDEASEPARKAKGVFDRVCRAELRRHAWSFAKARAILPALAQSPSFGWRYAYQLPSDFLRVLQVNDYADFAGVREQTDQIVTPYDIEGKTILTNYAAPLKLRYVRDMAADPNTWDDTFIEAFACRLGMELGFTLTKSDSSVQRCTAMYKSAVFEARRVNAIELPPIPLFDNSWMTGRD